VYNRDNKVSSKTSYLLRRSFTTKVNFCRNDNKTHIFRHNIDIRGNLDFLTLKQGNCCKYTTPMFFIPPLRVKRTHSPTILSQPHHLSCHRPTRSHNHRPPPSSFSTTVLHLLHLFVYLFSLFTIILSATVVHGPVQHRPPSLSDLDLTSPTTSSSPSRRRRSDHAF